jgi:hypothetical protein
MGNIYVIFFKGDLMYRLLEYYIILLWLNLMDTVTSILNYGKYKDTQIFTEINGMFFYVSNFFHVDFSVSIIIVKMCAIFLVSLFVYYIHKCNNKKTVKYTSYVLAFYCLAYSIIVVNNLAIFMVNI